MISTRAARRGAGRPAAETPAVALQEAVVAVVVPWRERRAEGLARRSVVDATPALAGRERAKLAAHERVLVDGLVARGVGPDEACLLASAAVVCAVEGLRRWLADPDPAVPGLTVRVRSTFAELGTALGATRRRADR